MAVEVKFTGDADQLKREEEAVAAATDKVKESFRASAAEARQLEQFARRAFENTRTPAEKHAATMEKLRLAYSAGKLDMDTYGRAAQQAARRLEEANKPAEEFVVAQNEFVTQAASIISGYLGVSNAISLVSEALREAVREQREFADASRATVRGAAQFLQLTGEQAGFDRLAAAARDIRGRGVGVQPGAAEEIVFRLESAGLLEERGSLIRAAALGIIPDVQAAVRAAATAQGAFGREEAGSLLDLINKSLVAASRTQFTAEDVLSASATTATAARAVGLSDEANLALFARVSQATPDPSTAATQTRAFLSALDKAGIRDANLESLLAKVVENTNRGTDLRSVFTEDEGLRGARAVLADTRFVTDLLRQIDRANQTDVLAERTALAERIPDIDAERRRAVSEGQRAIAGRDLALIGQLRESEFGEAENIRLLQGRPSGSRFFSRMLDTINRTVFGIGPVDLNNPGQINSALLDARRQGNQELIEAINRLRETQDQLRRQMARENRPAVTPNRAETEGQ